MSNQDSRDFLKQVIAEQRDTIRHLSDQIVGMCCEHAVEIKKILAQAESYRLYLDSIFQLRIADMRTTVRLLREQRRMVPKPKPRRAP